MYRNTSKPWFLDFWECLSYRPSSIEMRWIKKRSRWRWRRWIWDCWSMLGRLLDWFYRKSKLSKFFISLSRSHISLDWCKNVIVVSVRVKVRNWLKMAFFLLWISLAKIDDKRLSIELWTRRSEVEIRVLWSARRRRQDRLSSLSPYVLLSLQSLLRRRCFRDLRCPFIFVKLSAWFYGSSTQSRLPLHVDSPLSPSRRSNSLIITPRSPSNPSLPITTNRQRASTSIDRSRSFKSDQQTNRRNGWRSCQRVHWEWFGKVVRGERWERGEGIEGEDDWIEGMDLGKLFISPPQHSSIVKVMLNFSLCRQKGCERITRPIRRARLSNDWTSAQTLLGFDDRKECSDATWDRGGRWRSSVKQGELFGHSSTSSISPLSNLLATLRLRTNDLIL